MHKRKRQLKNKRDPLASNKARITRFLEEIEWLFDYSNFDRSICYCSENENDAAAEVKTDLEYRRITIHLKPSFFKHNLREQRELLLHEFCHTFTDKIYKASVDLLNGKLVHWEGLKNINEEATSRITNTIDALLRGRKQYATKAYKNYLK